MGRNTSSHHGWSHTWVAVSVPAVIGGAAGALAALALPSGNQGDVLSATPASSKS